MKKPTDFLEVVGLERKNHAFEPYGVSCRRFPATIMPCMDRHNEIEIVYALGGGVTYFIQDRTVVVPPRCIAIFWGMFPHRIVETGGSDGFYLCTIPLLLFLGMGLSEAFMNNVFKGEILFDEDSRRHADYDLMLLENWRVDLETGQSNQHVVLLEMQARLIRMSQHVLPGTVLGLSMQAGEMDLVERMTLYIAANCHRSIKVADIGRAVGLHPDYANTLFKRAIGHTLSYHLMLERITLAQRKLLMTTDTVVHVSETCGFNSLSSFNSAFLKFNNCTPRDYRKLFHINPDVKESKI